MITEVTKQGVVLRVRCQPNSSSCLLKGVFIDADGNSHLKISVVSVPEKGKANAELVKFLASKIKIAKSEIEVVGGETDRYKKVLVRGTAEDILPVVRTWLKSEGIDE